MRLSWALALCLLCSAPGEARPFSVEDLLRLESYGQVLVDPGQHWAVADRRGPYESASSFRYGYFNNRLVSRILRIDVRTGATAPLLRSQRHAGYWAAGFSPSGTKLAVYRLGGDRLTLGVVDVARRKVTWLALSPDLRPASPNPTWLGEDRLLVVAFERPRLPAMLRSAALPARLLPGPWRDALVRNRPSATVLGTGAMAPPRAEALHRLVLYDLRRHSENIVLRGDVDDVAVAPGGRWAAVTLLGEQVQPRLDRPVSPSDQPRRRRLLLLDLATGTVQREARLDIAPNLLSWSPEGARLLFFGRGDNEDWPAGRLYAWRAGEATPVHVTPPRFHVEVQRELGSSLVVSASWGGDRVVARGTRPGELRSRWFVLSPGSAEPAARGSAAEGDLVATSRSALDFLVGGDLWRVDRNGREERLAGDVVAVEPERLDPVGLGSRAYFNDRPSEPRLVLRRSQDGRTIAGGDPGSPSISLDRRTKVLAVGKNRAFGLTYRTDATGVGFLQRLDADGRAHTLDVINRHLAPVDTPRSVLLQTVTRDGHVLRHWLLLPSPASAPPPLVVIPYPGAVFSSAEPDMGRPSDFLPEVNPYILTGLGFAVLMPSLPLTHSPADPMEELAEPVLAAVRAAKQTGLVSLARPAVYGHSFGGYAALALNELTDEFCSAIAAAAPSDLLALYGSEMPQADVAEEGLSLTFPAGWAESGQGGFGAPPWKDLDRYRRNSPFYRAADMAGPVLLLHGDFDYVPVAQAERMLFALHRAGKDAQLVRYAGEGHVLAVPANIRDEWKRIGGFLAETAVAAAGDKSEAPCPRPRLDARIGKGDPRTSAVQEDVGVERGQQGIPIE